MKRMTLLFALMFVISSSVSAFIGDGSKAPEFTVKSGDDSEMTLKKLEGTVVTIFYEAKDKAIVEKNRHLKDELNRFFAEQTDVVKGKISRVAIIDCRGASWPFKGIWEGKLRESSIKEGLTIYGDWDGDFAGKYQVVKDESNFIIIDKKGIVRFARVGRIDDAEIPAIENLIKLLSAEGQ
jgi:hypothetical protein